MDRNIGVGTTRDRRGVALRKESVDRNMGASYGRTAKMVSLSARRAWIEIALAPEQNTAKQRSLSARRAWIEIQQ